MHCFKRRRHKCLSRQSIAGQIVAVWYMYIHMRSSSGLFHVHINAKSVNQFPAGSKRKFTPPSFGKECKRHHRCRSSQLRMQNRYFLYLMTEGELNMQILLVCQYHFVYSKKKKYIKKPKKKQKLNWDTEARNRTCAVGT